MEATVETTVVQLRDLAERFLLMTLENDPKNVSAANQLALLYFQREDLERSSATFRKLVDICPPKHLVNVLCNYGVSLQLQRKWSEALAVFTTALEIGAENAFVCNNIGNIHRIQGNYDLSEAFYLTAIISDPSYALVYSNMSLLRILKRDWALALAYLDRALTIDPSLTCAVSNRKKLVALLIRERLSIEWLCHQATQLQPKLEPDAAAARLEEISGSIRSKRRGAHQRNRKTG